MLKSTKNKKIKPIIYFPITENQIEILIKQGNYLDDVKNMYITPKTDIRLIKNCNFFGTIKIGELEKNYINHHYLKLPIGIYSSTLQNCEIGNNVSINNAKYVSKYIIGNNVILMNVNEMVTTDYPKFGNGVIFKNESEDKRIWIEVCNENTGRKILPFDGMLPADAYLWSQDRDDIVFQQKLKEITCHDFENKMQKFGKIGDNTIIKNCTSIKDVLIGSFAYLKGVNKLKNVTIHSKENLITQIGEGCELVNGIIGFDCKIFYGVKAVRFIISDHSQLKYGARLINSFLGFNSVISCCEVLNSLLFYGHAQHHNNSFLCAALIKGQSNIAAGVTIGSNHNSRGADGEIVAGKGFWPALCVSLKHNSIFSSYNFIAKGDYNYELNNPFPFSLISNDLVNNRLIIYIAFWQKNNMYALARNDFKYAEQDKRKNPIQQFDFNYLSPDTIHEIELAINLLIENVGNASIKNTNKTKKSIYNQGKFILENETADFIQSLPIHISSIENSKRNVQLLNIKSGYFIYLDMLFLYGMAFLINLVNKKSANQSVLFLKNIHHKIKKVNWHNVGGQLMIQTELDKLKNNIKKNKIKTWQEIHHFYKKQSDLYNDYKNVDGLYYLSNYCNIDFKNMDTKSLKNIFEKYISVLTHYTNLVISSRQKDYENPFILQMYKNKAEMEKVYGKLFDNKVIIQQMENLKNKKIQLLGK